jgi:hypothetical protein
MTRPPSGTNDGGTTRTTDSTSGNLNSNSNFAIQSVGRKMPKPGERNAPTFDPEKSEELGRFFDRIDEWFAEDGVNNDADRKRCIVRYLDAESEMQWKALSKFADGTYAEFRTQVMASYPRAEEVLRGSVIALSQRLKKIDLVALEERDRLLLLIRIMTAEVSKLRKISPPIHTNRELVELFLSRLTPAFAARLAENLSLSNLTKERNSADRLDATRNAEDMYDLEMVMEIAKHTSLEFTSPFGVYLQETPVFRAATDFDELEEAIARLEDSVNLQLQFDRQLDQQIAYLQSLQN